MLKMIKSQNPNKEYPSNLGQKWSDAEEIILLEELNKNIDIETIAQNHSRTKGGIYSRRNHIAYKMYLKNISMEEIIEKTKLDEDSIKKTIEKNEIYNPKSYQKKTTEIKKPFLIETEIFELKNEIKELKNNVKELVEMMKAVYEFEDT